MPRSRYSANLQRVGAVLGETRVLLETYVRSGSWETVRKLSLKDNLLKKGSTTTVTGILRAVYKRYFKGPEWLPPAKLTAKFFDLHVPERAKAQIALIYIAEEDALFREILCNLIHPRLSISSSVSSLRNSEVVAFIDEKKGDHPELRSWSPYLVRRWARGFLSILRDIGILEAPPGHSLRNPPIRVEAFAFIFLWLLKSLGSARRALNHKTFEPWFLKKAEINRLFLEGQERGWWTYAAAPGVLEVNPKTNSVEEWLDGLAKGGI